MHSHKVHIERIKNLESKFGSNIKDILKKFIREKKLTNKEISKILGISVCTLQEWFIRFNITSKGSGNYPKSPEHIANIAKALKGRKLSKSHIEAFRKTNYATGFWKGYYIDKSGYKWIRIPNRGYVAEHRLVMEKFIGRSLHSFEHVHHIDCNRLNNKISNLAILSKREHYFIEKLISNLSEVAIKTCIKSLKYHLKQLQCQDL